MKHTMLLLAIVFLTISCDKSGQTEDIVPDWLDVELAKVKDEKNISIRAEIMEGIYYKIRKRENESLEHTYVDRFDSFLEHESKMVEYYARNCLGQLGAKAARKLPYLEDLYERVKKMENPDDPQTGPKISETIEDVILRIRTNTIDRD